MRAYPPEAIFFQDEMRVGTRTELGRKWGPCAHRPLGPVHIGYQFTHLFVALAPLTGQVFAMFLPELNKVCFQHFGQQLNQEVSQPTLLIADRATAHQAKLLTETHLVLTHLPTACPELNPVERFFEELRRQLKSRVFDSLWEAQVCVERVLQIYLDSPERVIQLAAYPYIRNTS
ncbi:IS630 family transposase [Spirosoma luteum]|uniref:IS630 family transposase n=1 Tax=Spirosoma luteum TaxID=431553 RepID=UPI0003786C35|nr:IS630 family transposase [Spirosoma luteum]